MRIELSVAALDILWEDLSLGRPPFPLEIPSHGDTAGIRARIRTAVYAALARRDLAVGTRPTTRWSRSCACSPTPRSPST